MPQTSRRLSELTIIVGLSVLGLVLQAAEPEPPVVDPGPVGGPPADALVLFEIPDVRRVLEEGAFWDIYYEHCSYFTLGSLACALANTAPALELFRAGVHVTLVHRHATLGDSIKYWVRPDIENRIKEGSIAARFEAHVVEIQPTAVVIEQHGRRESLPADGVFLLTGYHPDADLMVRAGVHCDPVSLMPDLHPETYETNVPNLFLAGGCVAGRNTGSIFIENGRFHGEKIIKVLAERFASETVRG